MAAGAECGVELHSVANNNLLPCITRRGELTLRGRSLPAHPDFVIFWDKDILLAKYLEKMGFFLFNSAQAIALCDDKAEMHLRLAGENIRMPKTVFSPLAFYEQELSDGYLAEAEGLLGFPLVLKEVSGSFGMQVYKIESRQELKAKIRELGNKRFILQEMVQSSYGRDIRVNIIGDKVIGAMLRQNPQDFRANITLGGTASRIELSAEQEELALKAHRALGLEFSGVDLLFGEEEPILCEVNSNVNFLSFESVSGIDFAERLLTHVKRKIIA